MSQNIGKEYKGIDKLKGPILILEGAKDVGYQELVRVRDKNGKIRTGQVLKTSEDYTVVQIFEGTRGITKEDTYLRFLGEPFKLPVSDDMLGRIFTGIGEPMDAGPNPHSEIVKNINGNSINPMRRKYPRNYIRTGISSIDALNTLVRGQKLPIFSGSGLPHNKLIVQIITQSEIEEKGSELAIIFGAIGLMHDEADYFIRSFKDLGALDKTTLFLNLATDPAEERIITPRCALTLAEHLAFEKDRHVLVILSDMTNYCESLREIGAAREEVPSRKGFPGYLYSDLASIYERSGMIQNKNGSITQIPIITMPNMDITHPIPDLTGYITEGQLVLSRELNQKNIYPPMDVLPSLSRLMKDGIGEDLTRADHPNLSSQLYALYSHVQEVRAISSIIGEEELSDLDKRYLEFGNKFEKNFIGQDERINRTIEDTLNLGWKLVSIMPKSVLQRVSTEEIKKYYES